MNRLIYAALFFLISSGCAWAGKPLAAVKISKQLPCGSAILEAKTQRHKKLSTQVIRQQLSLYGAATPLAQEQSPDRLRLKKTDRLPFYLSGWACLTNDKQQAFFYLAYYCAAEAGCADNKEWGRLMSLDGRILNVQANELEAVMRTNGLERYVQNGVELLDPLE
ncbi:MAG: hypothetical protein RL497_1481 [Pseudomonadota bacterium]|jgi:hypothetical protein